MIQQLGKHFLIGDYALHAPNIPDSGIVHRKGPLGCTGKDIGSPSFVAAAAVVAVVVVAAAAAAAAVVLVVAAAAAAAAVVVAAAAAAAAAAAGRTHPLNFTKQIHRNDKLTMDSICDNCQAREVLIYKTNDRVDHKGLGHLLCDGPFLMQPI